MSAYVVIAGYRYWRERLTQTQRRSDFSLLHEQMRMARDRADDRQLSAEERELAQRELERLKEEYDRDYVEITKYEFDTLNRREYRDAEQMTYSLILGIYAALLLLVGLLARSAVLRLTAVVLFIAVIGKVFFIDLSSLDTIYRIISFIVLGFILLGVSLLYTLFRKQVNAFVLADGEERNHA